METATPLLTRDDLDLTSADFPLHGADLLGRWRNYALWIAHRCESNVFPYSKATSGQIHTDATSTSVSGHKYNGVNFASQDYLNLAAHPKIHQAAKAAIDTFGVHSAGSVALMGNTQLSLQLEERLAQFLGYTHCTVFPTGWGAGYGVVKTLVGENDHIVIDVLAHACLHEGARNATKNVHTFPHCSNEAVQRRLKRIREENPDQGILVVTEGVFSMDSDVPDIADLQRICREFGAFLLVDVAHDLGALGPTGRGVLELQNIVGKVDIVMGSFSKTFASNGGFVASNESALRPALHYMCGPLTFTNALSPVQASIVLAALDIIENDEGRQRRAQLMRNVLHLRKTLAAEGFALLGQPSAIVPVVLGAGPVSRLATRHALENGAILNLVEYPAVSRNSSRWRLQVMAEHTDHQIETLVRVAVEARQTAREIERQMHWDQADLADA